MLQRWNPVIIFLNSTQTLLPLKIHRAHKWMFRGTGSPRFRASKMNSLVHPWTIFVVIIKPRGLAKRAIQRRTFCWHDATCFGIGLIEKECSDKVLITITIGQWVFFIFMSTFISLYVWQYCQHLFKQFCVWLNYHCPRIPIQVIPMLDATGS